LGKSVPNIERLMFKLRKNLKIIFKSDETGKIFCNKRNGLSIKSEYCLGLISRVSNRIS